MAAPQKNSDRGAAVLVLLAAVTAVLFCLTMTLGRYSIPLKTFLKVFFAPVLNIEQDWTQNVQNVVWRIRLPRVCGAIMVGSALSMSGAAYQSIFRNPLVSSDLLGVSAGACVGASLAIILDAPLRTIQLSSLCAGLGAVLTAVWISRLLHSRSNLILVLAGVIVSGFFRSVQGLLLYLADPDTQLGTITYWTLGSLAKISLPQVPQMGIPMLLCAVLLLSVRWRLNLLSLGENEARSLGVSVRLVRGLTVFCATGLTACAICMAGTVGWISLVIPHFSRLLVGVDNRRVIPASALLGASFLMAVDTLARSLTRSEIPLSVLTGFIGAPLYVWLLLRHSSNPEGKNL